MRRIDLPHKLTIMLRDAGLVLLLVSTTALAQTAPATTQAYHVSVPPGFIRIVESGHTFFAESADRPWIEVAARSTPPATRPSTQPADLLAKLTQHREAIQTQMTTLLALHDPAPVGQFLDGTLRPLIERYVQLHPPLIFLVTSQPRLKQILLEGWSDPRLHYNRAANDIDVSRGIRLSIDGPSDENLLPVIYIESSTTETRKADLSNALRTLDFQIGIQIANRAQADVQLAFVAFMAREVFEPLQFKQDEIWFSMGTTGVLSSLFVEPIDQIQSAEFISGLSRDRRDNPFRSAEINLLHPTALSELRAAAVPAYSDAYQRKSIRVLGQLCAQAGNDAPAKVIAALRDHPVADGEALLKLIQKTTGVDLADAVKPGR